MLVGPHTITVFPEVAADDDRGNPIRRPADTGVDVIGVWVQPASSEENAAASNGQVLTTLMKLIAPSAPVGPWALVRWDDRDFDVVGEPQVRNYGPVHLQHVTALLRARSPRSA